MSEFKNLVECVETINQLRDPQNGCPWDLKQTHESLLKYLLEESYEFFDAVERQDLSDMKDELGDVLLQVILHSRISEQNGNFSIEDVAQNLKEKIIERHPHVFSKDPKYQGISSDEVESNWKEIKSQNKANETVFSKKDLNFPSLFSSYKIGAKTTEHNFDWDDYAQVIYKVEEEWQELKEELTPHRPVDREKVEEELGDLLFSVAQLARHVEMNPEELLRKANQKFINRFTKMEALVKKRGYQLKDLNQDDLDVFWSQVKSQEY